MTTSDTKTSLKGTRLSKGDGHFFFGFHDIPAWNRDGDKVAILNPRTINRPPTPDDFIALGYLRASDGEFVPLGETNAYNYPQGARQLWTPAGDAFWVNASGGDHWVSKCYNVETGVIATSDQALHALSPDGRTGYGLDYSRLHRLGGYGYVGIPDPTADSPRPKNAGIWKVDLATGKSSILLSIDDATKGVDVGGNSHHYLTHLVVSPSGNRLMFLHRYWLPDGGIGNRLMACKSDGTDLQVVAEGFLSHFAWWTDDKAIIWGRLSTGADKLRRSPAARILAKPLRAIKRALVKGGSSPMTRLNSYLTVSLTGEPAAPFWPETLTEDGHPMFCPTNRDWLVTDTYPDANHTRELMLIEANKGSKLSLGFYQYKVTPVDMSQSAAAFQGLDPLVLKNMKPEDMAHARSGLHCDLHPRWSADGTHVGFDSIHEGTRQFYQVDVADAIGANF